MRSSGWVTWRSAWTQALYGPSGFYRTEQPHEHFRTSAHVSPVFAMAIVSLVRRLGLGAVTDYGAGSGELLGQIEASAPDLHLNGIELRGRPAALPPSINWSPPTAAGSRGGRPSLLIANELLDNIPCDVVERDPHDVLRLVEVEPSTGKQRLGEPACADVMSWIEEWWPCERVGQRAEVGLSRDELWADICSRPDFELCIAVDFGHLRESRPGWTTLSSYRRGRLAEVTLDGRHDVTAHVAFDSVAARVSGRLWTQRDMLRQLGVDARRPPLAQASEEPAAYVRALARATQAAELTAIPGLGSFFWLLSSYRQSLPAS